MVGISVWPVPRKLTQSWKVSNTRHLQELRSRHTVYTFFRHPLLLINHKLWNYITVTTPSRSPEYFPEPFLQLLPTVSLTYCPLRWKRSPSVKFLSNGPDKHGEQTGLLVIRLRVRNTPNGLWPLLLANWAGKYKGFFSPTGAGICLEAHCLKNQNEQITHRRI